MKEILLQRLEKVAAAYAAFKQNPADPETTHKLRVDIRKLRGLLNFLKPDLEERDYEALNRTLRDTGQLYGDLREGDVLTDLCQTLLAKHSELDTHSGKLAEFLRNERRKELVRVLKHNSSPTLKAVQKSLEHLNLPDKNWEKFVTKRLKKMHKKLEKSYEHLDKSDYRMVHQTRILAKKVRYAATDFNRLTTANVANEREYAEKIQEKLGKITDHYINKQILRDYAHEVRDPELKKLFNQMQELI